MIKPCRFHSFTPSRYLADLVCMRCGITMWDVLYGDKIKHLHKQKLYSIIQKALPSWLHDDICLVDGHWCAAKKGEAIYRISDALHMQDLLKREAAEKERTTKASAWRSALSDETAAGVEAMCRRLLEGNPNNRFVREVYPALYEQLVQEGQHVA